MAVYPIPVCFQIQYLICFSKQPRAQEKTYHIVGAQWVFATLTDEWLHGNKCNACYYPHCRHTGSITCWRTCVSDLAMEPGLWMWAQCSFLPINASLSAQLYTDGTRDDLRQCMAIASDNTKLMMKNVWFSTLFQLLQGESFRLEPTCMYIFNTFLHRLLISLLNRKMASHRLKPWQATASS